MLGDEIAESGQTGYWAAATGGPVRRSPLGLYDGGPIISKGHTMAPVWHTASQSVHQSHSGASVNVTTFLTTTSALHWHTVTHNPQPSHF